MSKENLKPLKTLVFSMGLLLLGGTVLLMALVWKKVTAETSGNHAVSSDCAGGEVDLKGRGAIMDSVIDGRTMRLTLEKADGTSNLVMVDICSGKITGTLVIHSDSDPLTE